MSNSISRFFIATLFTFIQLTVSGQCAPGATGNTVASTYTLVWADEFSEDGAVCSDNWFHQTQLPAGGNWYNNEQQHYTDDLANSSVANGMLKITAIKEQYTDQNVTKSYSSARLNSKYAFTYGRVDCRAKLPSGDGTWPAIWMLGQDIIEPGGYWSDDFGTDAWPAIGEIDIMEHWGNNPNVIHGSLHTTSSSGATQNTGTTTIPNVSTEFHVYSMIWDEDKIQFLVDDVAYYTYQPANKTAATWPFDSPQYFLLNIAMGGIGGAIDPNFTSSSMVIDYIRVYQKDVNGEPATEPLTAASTPTENSEDVLSIYSDSYTNLAGTNMAPNWSQDPPVVVTTESINSNAFIKYATLSYQGIELGSAIDVSSMEMLHLDVWSADISTLEISLISTGPVEFASSQSLTSAQWTSLDIPLGEYSETVNLQDVIQLKLEDTNVGGTLWLDNIYFYKEEVVPTAPSTPAPTPIVAETSVISIYSDSYEDVSGSNFNPAWNQSTQQSVETISGNEMLKYENFNYQGIILGANQDLVSSGMTYAHFDVWSTENMIGFSLINTDPAERVVKRDIEPYEWVSINILLSEFTDQGMTISDIKELKFDQGTGNQTVFIDNIFFYVSESPGETQVRSEYCETEVLAHAGDEGSDILLTIDNVDETSMIVTIESTNSDPVDELVISGGHGANLSAKDESVSGQISVTMTWSAGAPNDVSFGILWSKVSFAGNWSLRPGSEEITVPFKASCSVQENLTISTSTTTIEDVSCGDLVINQGAVYTVAAGHTLSVLGDIEGLGELIINSGASLITYDGNNIGNVTIKRNTSYSDGRYSFVGSPVNSDESITGENLGSTSLWYDETEAYGEDGLARWKDASNLVLTPGWGYAQAFQKEISFSGVPNDGPITVSGLTHTSGASETQGWALVSNPYPAAIAVDDFLSKENNQSTLTGSIYLWDDHGSESGRGDNSDYLTVNNLGTVGGPNGGVFNGYIGSMQGFFVKIEELTADASVEFTEEMRVGAVNSDDTFLRDENEDFVSIKLSVETADGLTDELLVGLIDGATDDVEKAYDAHKFIASKELEFYSLINDEKFAIQGLPLITGISTDLGLDMVEGKAVTMKVLNLSGLTGEKTFYLRDLQTGKVYDLSKRASIDFTVSELSSQNRFTLLYDIAKVLSSGLEKNPPNYHLIDSDLFVSFDQGTVIYSYLVTDLSGKEVSTKSFILPQSELHISLKNTGINILKINTNLGVFTKKYYVR